MTLQVTYYGAASIGGSNQDPDASINYCVPITVTADGLAVGVEAALIGSIFRLDGYLLADNGGSPGDVLTYFGRVAQATTMSTTVRWVVIPTMYWVTAGDYWIGVHSPDGTGSGQLKYDTGASGVGFTVDGGTSGAQHEPGATGVTSTATTRAYSIRLAVLTEGAATQTLTGSLFTATPTFPTGEIIGPKTLNGVLFQKTPTFPTGVLSGGSVLLGAEFTKAPTFFVGAVTGATLTLQGSLFTKAPTFPPGVIAGGGQTLTGSPFQSGASFFTGLVVIAGSGGTAPSDTDEGLRFEVWSLPQIGSFVRRFDLTRWINSYTIADKFGEISDGTLTIADSLPAAKLDKILKVDRENHANDVGSVIRVLRGTTPILHYVTKQFDDTWSSDDPTARLHLEGMELLLDRATVPRYDYPDIPSVEPDWIYGAHSVLTNTDFEISGSTSEVVSLEVNATAGTFKIGIDYPVGTGYVYTGNIAWNPVAQDIAIAIETLMSGWDVFVTGAGTPTNPFNIEVLSPTGEDIGWVTDSGLLTGLASIETSTPGGNLVAEPWTRSTHPITGVFHGSYTEFEISTDQARSAPYSLKVDGDPPAAAGAFPGAQQLLSVTGGRTYRASVWVYPTQTGPFRFVIRTRDETFIAQDEQTLTANQWNELSIPAVLVPKHVSQIVFRVATISNGDEPAWYVDDALFAPGAAAATYGKIRMDILTAVQAQGVLTWLTPTWSETHDSAGVPWDRDLEWQVKRGQTQLQLNEYATKWNYESIIRWDDAQSRFEWDLFNPTTAGTNYFGSGLAITGKSISSSGVVARRFPEASYFHAEGANGQWGEHEDSPMATSWGRLEKYFANAQGLDADGLEELAERLVNDAVDRVDGLSVRLQAPSALPWSKFKPADSLNVNLEPKRDAELLRCMAVVASKGPNDATTAYDAHFGSVVYQGEAAVLQTLRILWREFKALQAVPATRETIVNPVLPAEPPAPPDVTEVIIAAVNTEPELKALADYVCQGVDDQDTWRTMLTSLGLVSDDNVGGRRRVKVLDGDYFFDDNLLLDQAIPGFLQFVGEGQPRIVLNYDSGGFEGIVGLFNIHGGGTGSLRTLPQVKFENLFFDGNNQANGRCFYEWTLTAKPLIEVASCRFENWEQNLWLSERDSPRFFHHNLVFNCPLNGGAFHFDAGTSGASIIDHNYFFGCSGNMVNGFAFGDHCLVHGNVQLSGTMVLNALAGITYANNIGF